MYNQIPHTVLFCVTLGIILAILGPAESFYFPERYSEVPISNYQV